MTSIAAKQKPRGIWEPRLRGNFASSKGWAVSFLNFQISKAGIKNMELTWSPNLNVAHHTIGKERAALFRRYRVATRKRGPDVVRRVTRDNFRPVLSLQRDNGRWRESTRMHTNQFREIMRDAEVAYAIGPIVRKHQLDLEETTSLLQKCGVARARDVAHIATSTWLGLPSGIMKEWIDMPTYIYETTDTTKPIRQVEVKQSVHDEPLHVDPETGEAIRRVISAGYSVLVPGKSRGPSVGSCG